MTASISIRTATLNDIPAVLAVEESWEPEGRAGADKFMSRLNRFGQGFLVAELMTESGVPTVVATLTSMPLLYTTDLVANFTSWDHVTNHGFLPEVTDWEKVNALYIVSGVIDARHRGLNIFTPTVLQAVTVAQELGMRYVLAGAVMPGYDKYCTRHSHVSAAQYSGLRRGKHLVDPLLAMYEAIDFFVPDEQHIVSNYYPDNASRDYAAIVVRDLQKHPA